MQKLNYLLELSYDGTNYAGFQWQKNAVSVQQKLEEAIEIVYKQKIRINGAGRTDAGVHARGQVINFHAPPLVPVERIPHALNRVLPGDIVVCAARQMPNDFHARLRACGKIYSYTIDTTAYRQVLRRLYTWHCSEQLNIAAMKSAALLYKGSRNFRAYQAAKSNVEGTVRTITRLDIEHIRTEQLLVFTIAGDGFLYKMVRFIIGALVEAGKEMLHPEDIKASFFDPFARVASPLPAVGLCLEKVFYPDGE